MSEFAEGTSSASSRIHVFGGAGASRIQSGVSEIGATLFWGPYNKDPII